VRLENTDKRFSPGDIAGAFVAWRSCVYGPRKYLILGGWGCDCCGPPIRDVLDEAVARLPKRPARELRLLIAPLDEHFLDRTYPDPTTPPGSWWAQRC
jgi:hypothetical protein